MFTMRLAPMLLLALGACGDNAPAPEGNVAAAAPGPAKSAPKKVAAPAAAKAAPGPATAKRCGWLHNPTPANWWLTDRDGEWILMTQGVAEETPGMEEIPDMSQHEWEETHGHYGYGCACMTVTADPATRRVLRIAKVEPKPLATCRADRALPAA